jgi:hypothetical protein
MNNSLMWNTIKISLVAIMAIVVLFFGIRAGYPSQVQNAVTEQQVSATISIDGLFEDKPILIQESESVLSVLTRMNVEDPSIQLVTKEYAGLGALVESIAGRTNGSEDRYWQYTVNDTMPQVGASAYELKRGDHVEWKFEPSEF